MKKTSKLLALLMALVMVLAMGLCACGSGAEPEEEDADVEEQTGLANPWTDVSTAEEAAEGAGVETFVVPEGTEISLGEIAVTQYRYMDGLAEADVEFPAVAMTIRKGYAASGEDGDISGDYNEYSRTWTQNIKGLEVTCFGNREGAATKAIWQLGSTCWSVTAYGLGGDTDYGLSADDLNSLINGIQ